MGDSDQGEGAERLPISTAPPAPMAAPARCNNPLPSSSASSRPARPSPRVLIPRLRKAGPKLNLDPEQKAIFAAHNARRALIAQREKGFPTDIVVAFVEELDKAHQYARFNTYLREEYGQIKKDSVRNDVIFNLIKDNERTNKFNLVDEYDIHTLVYAYFRELIHNPNYPKDERPVDGSIRNPVYYLEYRAREEGYVLDENPEVELKKLKKFAPTFYRNHFVCREPPAEVEARTVTVSNIAFDVSEKEIREFYRQYGIITCVEIESTPECQIAHITYKELKAAAFALTSKGTYSDKLSKLIKPFIMTPVSYPFPCIQLKPKFVQGSSGGESPAKKTEDVSSSEMRTSQNYYANIFPVSEDNEPSSWESHYAPLLVEPKFVQGSSGGEYPAKKSEDVSSMHNKALQKYSELRTYYSQNPSKHGEAAEKGGYGRCGWLAWMEIEGISNGGYTVGGQKLHRLSMAS